MASAMEMAPAIALPIIETAIILHNGKPVPLHTDGGNEGSQEADGEKTSPTKPVDIIAPDGKLIGVPGNGPDVQEMPDGYKGKQGLEGAEELYGRLTNGQGGKNVTPEGYTPGRTLTQLPNGDYIGIRPVSSDNETPSVDTNITGSPVGYVKFKFPK